MPKISTYKDHFFALLGKVLTEQQLEDLTFAYGIEAEEYQEIEEGKEVHKISFEIAANRPDLLCIEALVHSLRMYIGEENKRVFVIDPPKETIIVKSSVKDVRPYVVGAILRDVQLNENSYASFIDFQDKLHQNYCRKRTLVSIGTHDLDSIKGPFTYEANPPNEIVFRALKQAEELDCVQLFEKLDQDQYLKQYLHIIRNSPLYPVIRDSNGVVLSLPPIINGYHSRMSPATKNILIEVTAKDHQRALNILNCLVSGFAQYSKFKIESVNIQYEHETQITPDTRERVVPVEIGYVNHLLGINISTDQAVKFLKQMGIDSIAQEQTLQVTVPFDRTDILQQCDIAEDIGIAYGFNNIEMKIPETSTTGGEYLLNKLSDFAREEVAMLGFVECLNFVLCREDEQTTLIARPENKERIVHIQNSKSELFQCARTTLIPGILKTLKTNQKSKLPLSLFEVADIVTKGKNTDDYRQDEGQAGAVNRRYLCAVHSDSDTSGLEIIHGLLDQVMLKLRIKDYSLEKSHSTTFFPGLQASIIYKGQSIGSMGVLHPLVLQSFDWPYPAALIEIDLQTLLKDF